MKTMTYAKMTKTMRAPFHDALDIDNPFTRAIVAVTFLNLFIVLIKLIMHKSKMQPVDTYHFILSGVIGLMVCLYILSCFRNGNCNIFANVISIVVIVMTCAEIVSRIV